MTTPLPPSRAVDNPIFDSTRKALLFAFNATDTSIPAPVMNRVMSQISPKKVTKKALKERARALKLAGLEPETVFEQLRSRPQQQPGDLLRGLDKAAQAGFILKQVAKLDPPHLNALRARLTRSREPCSCRTGCCQGWRLTWGWESAVHELNVIVKESGDVIKRKGKKGLSSAPKLRQLLIERYFTTGDGQSTAQIARHADVSPITAGTHADWIEAYLERIENEAWYQIDAIFDQTGITGLLD